MPMHLPDEILSGTRTERILNSFFDLLKGNKRNHSGVRLIDELMVDIMGGLIPGVLFNFSILVCIVLPIFISQFINTQKTILANDSIDKYFRMTGGGNSPFGGWFWFAAFLTFLILSYIAGHIFFRSDINQADREDIKRRLEKNTKDVKNVLKRSKEKRKTIDELLQSELKQLITENSKIEQLFKKDDNSDEDSDDFYDEDLKLLLEHLSASVNAYIKESKQHDSAGQSTESQQASVQGTSEQQTAVQEPSEQQTAVQEPSEQQTKDKFMFKHEINKFLLKIRSIRFPYRPNKPKHADKITQAAESDNHLLTLFTIIFPHKSEETVPKGVNPWTASCEGATVNNYLNIEEKFIFDAYIDIVIKAKIFPKFKSHSNLKDNYSLNEITLLACYLILLLQNDSGCSHYEKEFEKHSYFPYLSFYKYLLKRNEFRLIRYVDWSPAGARTKNKINRMKMDVQLDYPDAYAIINKNESHIRMASSSWYVSRFAYKFAWWAFIAILLIRIPQSLTFKFSIQSLFSKICGSNLSVLTNHLLDIILPALPPVILAVLLYKMRHQLIKFIHYQRLREIYFTLYIFHKLDEIKKEEKKKDKPKEEKKNESVTKDDGRGTE